MIYEGDCGVIGGANDDCRGNRKTRRKPAQRPFVPIPHSWVRFRAPDHSGGKPATNRLSYGAAEMPTARGVPKRSPIQVLTTPRCNIIVRFFLSQTSPHNAHNVSVTTSCIKLIIFSHLTLHLALVCHRISSSCPRSYICPGFFVQQKGKGWISSLDTLYKAPL
jgi:hypothetical protein